MSEPYNRTTRNRVSCVRYNRYANNPVSTQFSVVQNADSSLAGFTNPGWRAALAQHRGATTACSGTFRSLDRGYIEAEAIRTQLANPGKGSQDSYLSYGSIWSGQNSLVVPSLPSASLDNDALTKFYQACNNASNQASGLLVLAELKRTVHQLKHPLRELTRRLTDREMRLRGRWNRAHKVTTKKKRKQLLGDFQNASADTWLEVQYGIQPLVHDIEDFVFYLQTRRFQVGVTFYDVHGTSRDLSRSVNNTLLEVLCGGQSSASVKMDLVTEIRRKVKYKGQFKVDPLNDWVDWRDFSRLGFSLRQFGPVLWEITPWSFLIDYFADVGGLIDSFNVPREDIAWYNKTIRAETSQHIYPNGRRSASLVTASYSITPGTVFHTPALGKCGQFVRSGSTLRSLPRPSIRFDLPEGKKIVNLIALAASNSRARFSNPL